MSSSAGASVVRGGDVEAVVLQCRGEHGTQVLLVVDDEQVLCAHGDEHGSASCELAGNCHGEHCAGAEAKSQRVPRFARHDACVETTTPDTNKPNPRRKRLLRWSLAALAVVVIAVGAFLCWFFRDDAPDAVSIGDAVAQVSDAAETTDAAAAVVVTEAAATETAETEAAAD